MFTAYRYLPWELLLYYIYSSLLLSLIQLMTSFSSGSYALGGRNLHLGCNGQPSEASGRQVLGACAQGHLQRVRVSIKGRGYFPLVHRYSR